MRLRALTLCALLLAGAAQAQPASPPLLVYAAGSTSGVLGAILKRYTAETGRPVELKVGSAGTMLDRIEAGEPADLFVSANLAHPERLTAEHKATATVVFARNRICLTARPDLGLTSANLAERLLDPKVRIRASKPKADPAGDYAWILFDRIGASRPGAAEKLKARAEALQAAAQHAEPAPAAPPANALAALDRSGADVAIGYCSSTTTKPDTSVARVQLPPDLDFPVDYGMTVLTRAGDPARREAADQLALYLMSPAVQAGLPAYGYIPVTTASPGS